MLAVELYPAAEGPGVLPPAAQLAARKPTVLLLEAPPRAAVLLKVEREAVQVQR